MRWILSSVSFVLLLMQGAAAPRGFSDRVHKSEVLGEERHYRIFLPAGYEQETERRYPVIYYFHGHSDRYTLEKYDDGKDTVPKIEQFVATHPVIVIAVDGYDARSYTGFYGGAPWDVMASGGQMDFGLYWTELVRHIDATYRTKASRRYRATSGLSMGGFMSLFVSSRFPDLAGSASSFNPGPEFFAGEPGRRILWRPKDHVETHAHTKIRLIRASGDYISQYHEETRAAYAREERVDFEFRQDEYHRHWATSIGETFEFHMRAFADARLDNRAPDRWSYSCAYQSCDAWDYRIRTSERTPAFVHLYDVTAASLSVRTSKWAPDGPVHSGAEVTITTAPRYRPNGTYQVRDSSSGGTMEVRADAAGRLTLAVNGDFHFLTLEGPGVTAPAVPVILPPPAFHVMPDAWVPLPLLIYNPSRTAVEGLRLKLSSDYPNAEMDEAGVMISRIEPGQTITAKPRVRFVSANGEFQRVRLTANCAGCEPRGIDTWVAPADTGKPWQVEILDGRTITLPVFRQKGNQGGGATMQRTVTEGRGNGNGVLEPGEQATIWVRLRQGLDPFDKGNWYRAKVYLPDQVAAVYLTEVGDIAEEKQREWTGARERTSLLELRPGAPPGLAIPLLLENESWSFHFTPDVRYGAEPLYQAFQLHRKHVHMHTIIVP